MSRAARHRKPALPILEGWRPPGPGRFAELSAKGVTFLQEPSERPYGVEAVMRDNSGNWLVLVEPREFTPEDFSWPSPAMPGHRGPGALA